MQAVQTNLPPLAESPPPAALSRQAGPTLAEQLAAQFAERIGQRQLIITTHPHRDFFELRMLSIIF